MEPAGGLCPVPLLSIWAWPILAFVPVEKTERPEKKERITEETRRDEQTEQSVETVEMPRPKSEVPVPESKDSTIPLPETLIPEEEDVVEPPGPDWLKELQEVPHCAPLVEVLRLQEAVGLCTCILHSPLPFE
jgi:hypothetical protein